MTSPNPIGEGAREIAGSLTAGQRKAILETLEGVPRGYGSVHGKVRIPLFNKHIFRYSGIPGGSTFVLTPLGLAVRSLLASTQVTK